MPDYKHDTARKSFTCNDCSVPIEANEGFYWDNTSKEYDAKGRRICQLCYQSKSSQSPTGPRSMFDKLKGSGAPQSDLNALQGRVAALEKQMIDVIKWIKEQE